MVTRNSKHPLFMIPHQINLIGEHVHDWSDVTLREQIILDMRNEIDKENVRLNRNINTFKADDCDVFQDRPEIIAYEQVTPCDWRPSVHHLESIKQIVQITADTGDKMFDANKKKDSIPRNMKTSTSLNQPSVRTAN